jgi:carbon starvation protein CstA
VFFGMMIAEGFIAMVWSAGALAIYNQMPELIGTNANGVLATITNSFLYGNLSTVVVISVIVLAVTSGDTAMRSLRLSLAEIVNMPQGKIRARILLCLPLIAIVSLLLWWSNKSASTFNQLWNYFAWGNQVLAASTLAAATVWLGVRKINCWIAWLPGAFMTFVVTTYILWISPAHGGPLGFGLELEHAYGYAGFTVVLVTLALFDKIRRANGENSR